MRVLVSGASGLVGSALAAALRAEGHQVNALVRPGKTPAPSDVRWDPQSDRLDATALHGVEAIVHLAGSSIASGRWTPARKQLLRASRVEATRNLVTALGRLERRPAVLVSASATGYYGDRGEELLTEASPPGKSFLARCAEDWEAEAARAEQHGIRVVRLRFGVVLAAHGGALKQMRLPFRLGLGGRLGHGRQWMSWISLTDAVGVIRYALLQQDLQGPVNTVAPNPVRNIEFTRILARVLRRPAIVPAPAFVLRLVLGELADELLLSSARVIPERLQQRGYSFQHPTLEAALTSVLNRG
ncbi:MAG: TIGR01777 family oxidoreductase [Firmicutes bacterium]|nr:TIGR01777 family oxidoreductase [Bacillota bacterium]